MQLLCCPHCKNDLMYHPEEVACATCQRQWPIFMGIPDFRPQTLPYVQADLQQAEALAALYHTVDRDALIAHSVELGSFYLDQQASPKLKQQRIRGRQQWEVNSHTLASRLKQMTTLVNLNHTDAAADVGCGSGSHLPALAEQYQAVVGMDASLAELLLAKKLLESLNLTHVQLACAFAEQLPIKTQQLNFAVALYVLEHVQSAVVATAEVYRALKSGGCFYFAVPYRYTLVPPEPHTHVWYVGWLPRRWHTPYVQIFKPNFDFDSIHLFSYAELETISRTLHGSKLQFFDPGFDRRFPPVHQKQRLWQQLQRFQPMLHVAKIAARRSIHAVITRYE